MIKLVPYQNYPKNKIGCLIFFVFPDVKVIAIGRNQAEVVKITLKIYVFT
ncbi:MAG: hypothetical protein U9R43_07265 [Thermodesulfobacteriota bacterium]|nr:hypothetical protein [Thermodesulfobacteriota bacterium]